MENRAQREGGNGVPLIRDERHISHWTSWGGCIKQLAGAATVQEYLDANPKINRMLEGARQDVDGTGVATAHGACLAQALEMAPKQRTMVARLHRQHRARDRLDKWRHPHNRRRRECQAS